MLKTAWHAQTKKKNLPYFPFLVVPDSIKIYIANILLCFSKVAETKQDVPPMLCYPQEVYYQRLLTSIISLSTPSEFPDSNKLQPKHLKLKL